MLLLIKKLRTKIVKARAMAKRKKPKGRSARHGKAQSCYQKYSKVPHKYSSEYQEWFRETKAGRRPSPKPAKTYSHYQVRHMLPQMAAE